MQEGYVDTYYSASVSLPPRRSPLIGKITADVCIVGGGFTGLSTALHLAEEGADVVLLEAERIGWGASGRNAGQVLNGLHTDIDSYVKKTSPSHRDVFESALFEGPKIISRIRDHYKIDADYRPLAMIAALTKPHLHHLAAKVAEWKKYGHQNVELIEGTEIENFINHRGRYKGLLIDWRGGHFNPLKMALGEAAAVESLKGHIFENSNVLKIERGAGNVVHTATGIVEAETLVIAGNAYVQGLAPTLDRRSLVVGSQIVTTEILKESLAKYLFPVGGCVEEMILDANFYRLTADNRLCFGAGVNLGKPGSTRILETVMPRMVALFPEMQSLKVDYSWACNFLVTLNGLPQIGQLGKSIFYSQGCNGFGISSSHLAGKIIAEAIVGNSRRIQAFEAISHMPIPGRSLFRVPYVMAGAYAYRLRDMLGI